MCEFSFKDYAPALNDEPSAKKIYSEILQLDPKNNEVTIDMLGMVAMTSICAREIFGELYLQLGADIFSKNIKFKNISEAITIVIKWGIKYAIDSRRETF